MRFAITREVSTTIDRCELTHLDRTPIDVATARLQHRRYEDVLTSHGCTLVRLPADDRFPDAVFVEDTAVVVDEIAVLTRPGAASRRREVEEVGAVLARFRPLARIEPPAVLDGGDVLRIGRKVTVGTSSRTTAEGVDALRSLLAPFGYEVRCIDVFGALHLKSAVTLVAVGEDPTLLIDPGIIDPAAFPGCRTIAIDPSEPGAANALLVGDTAVFPAEFPATRARLEAAGIRTVAVEASELAKAEGGVTCCAIVFDAATP